MAKTTFSFQNAHNRWRGFPPTGCLLFVYGSSLSKEGLWFAKVVATGWNSEQVIQMLPELVWLTCLEYFGNAEQNDQWNLVEFGLYAWGLKEIYRPERTDDFLISLTIPGRYQLVLAQSETSPWGTQWSDCLSGRSLGTAWHCWRQHWHLRCWSL